LQRERRDREASSRAVVPPPPGPASELQIARGLRDDGTITADEFEAIKRRILA